MLHIRYLFLLVLTALSTGCVTLDDTTALRATDDCGPKPTNYREIAAQWFNANYSYTPPTPVRPEEFSVTEPTKVATSDALLGRKVGWQIILGPENKMVTNFTELTTRA